MSARAANRLRAVAGLLNSEFSIRGRRRPERPRKILVLHELLLGDTLMLAPLFAALRARYPSAEIYASVKPEYAPLFSGRPWGVHALPFTEREPRALKRLAAAKGCDLAILPGETRHAVGARALGAKWIVAFAGAGLKDRLVDERVRLPARPASLADMFASLSGYTGKLSFHPGDWPAPAFGPYERPNAPYAVLHVGAGSPLRLWQPEKWRAVAEFLYRKGISPVWSAAKAERNLIKDIDPKGSYVSLAGRLDLAQLWDLLARAERLVALDSGIAHLAKLAGARTVALYGPGSSVLFGRGEYWRAAPFTEVTIPDFPCRDQRRIFQRELAWVRRCNRTLAECPRARCMEAIGAEQVIAAIH